MLRGSVSVAAASRHASVLTRRCLVVGTNPSASILPPPQLLDRLGTTSAAAPHLGTRSTATTAIPLCRGASVGRRVRGRTFDNFVGSCRQQSSVAMIPSSPIRINYGRSPFSSSSTPRMTGAATTSRSSHAMDGGIVHRPRPSAAHLSTTTAAASAAGTSADSDHVLELYMWGTDTKGSLLKPKDRVDEKILDVPRPIEGATLASFYGAGSGSDNDNDDSTNAPILSKVLCGANGTAYLLSNGSCYVTGENKYGQLGVGHKEPVITPAKVVLPPPTINSAGEELTDITIADLALGPSFAAAVDSIGNLYTCGFGGSVIAGFGMLGHGNAESITRFQQVQSLVEDQCLVQQVQVGESHMTVLTTEGEVLTCGAGSYGRLGNFDTVDQLCLEPVEVLTVDHQIIQIASGKAYTLALTSDGVLYGWGRNHQGQLGVGLGLAVDMYAMQNIPEPIETDELVNRKVVKVAAGPSHAACITSGGELFYWGMGLHLEPVRVNALMHTQVVDVVCGKEYTIAQDVDGILYSFGKGKNGCLGQGGTVKQLHQATRMEAFRDDQTIIQLSAGWDHAACLVQSPASAKETSTDGTS